MATLKTLAVNLDLERTQFSRELQDTVAQLDTVDDMVLDVGDSIEDFGKTVNNTGRTAAGSGGNYSKLSQNILEVGRLAEDASVGFGMGGLAGAIRAGTNNVVQLAANINPLAGGIAGISLALVPLAMNFLNVASAAEQANAQMERARGFAATLGNARERAVGEVQIQQQLGNAENSDQAEAIRQQLADQAEILRAERAEIENSIALLEADAPEATFSGGFWGEGSFDTTARDQYMQEIVEPLRQQLEQIESQEQMISAGVGEAERRVQSLQRSEEFLAVDAAQDAALGERLQSIGSLFNSLPEALEPLAENLEAADQQLREFDQRMQADLAAREAAELERVQQLADAPAQLTTNLQRGSAEAFRQILQQQADRPNARLETINSEQLAELRAMRRDQAARQREASRYIEEIEL